MILLGSYLLVGHAKNKSVNIDTVLLIGGLGSAGGLAILAAIFFYLGGVVIQELPAFADQLVIYGLFSMVVAIFINSVLVYGQHRSHINLKHNTGFYD